MAYVTANGITLRTSSLPTSWIGVGAGGYLTGGSAHEGFYGSPDATLAGGLGDDTYIVWDTSTKIVEATKSGTDTVESRIWGKAVLPANTENLILGGPGTTGGTGNGVSNIIIAGSVGATLDGRGGNDVLVGGAGADIFRVKAGNGSDAIVDFTHGSDVIELVNYGITQFDQLEAIATQTGSDLRFSFANGEALVLRNTTLAGVDAYDFALAAPSPVAAPGEGVLTGPGAVYTDNGWYVLNNIWNAGSLVHGTHYTINTTYDPGDLTTGVTFTWSFPRSTEAFPTILAYPEVIFGPAPMSGGHKPTDTADFFPLQVADIDELTADYDVSYAGNTDWFNVSFDLWFTDTPNGGASTTTNEVMIWVHKGGLVPYGSEVGTFSDGAISAKIYTSGLGDWGYTAVVLDEDAPVGEISVKAIMDKLGDLGILSEEEYLASAELGAEIVGGAGSLTINELTLTATVDDWTFVSSGAETEAWQEGSDAAVSDAIQQSASAASAWDLLG